MVRGSPFSYDPSTTGASSAAPTLEPEVDPLLAGTSEPRTVLVAGAGGFVGRHLLRRLHDRGHRVRGLGRRPAPLEGLARLGWWRCDLTDRGGVTGAAEGCDVVVHLVGIAEEGEQTFSAVHREGTENLVAEAERAGVERFIYVSAAGAAPQARAGFCRTKYEAEEVVRGSGLEHVIFRPSVIYGPEDHFTTALVTLLRKLPVFPVLEVGPLRLQPVSIEDVAEALAQAVDRDDVCGRTYELAGPERLKFTKIVRIVASHLGLRRPIVHLPAPVARVALAVVERFGLPAPLTPQQLDLLRESGVLSRRENALRTVFQVEPLPFRDAVADYL